MSELKNLQANGLTTLGQALKNTFDVLNVNRMQVWKTCPIRGNVRQKILFPLQNLDSVLQNPLYQNVNSVLQKNLTVLRNTKLKLDDTVN